MKRTNQDIKNIKNIKEDENDEKPLFTVSGAGKFKKAKTDRNNVNLADEFGKMYANALYDMSANRSFNEDGGCYYDMLQTEVVKTGDWMRIYQPTKGMKEYDGAMFYYVFKYKEPITPEQFKTFQPIINTVKKIYLQSYNDVLKKTENKWSSEIETGTFEEIAQIEKDLYLDEKGVIKMSLTIRGYNNWTCNDWWDPIRLRHWMTDCEYDETNYVMNEDTLERYAQFKCDATPAKICKK